MRDSRFGNCYTIMKFALENRQLRNPQGSICASGGCLRKKERSEMMSNLCQGSNLRRMFADQSIKLLTY